MNRRSLLGTIEHQRATSLILHPISPAEKPYFVIAAGDTFELKTRTVTEPATDRTLTPKNTPPIPTSEK